MTKTLAYTLHGDIPTWDPETDEPETYQYVVETNDIEQVVLLSDDVYVKITNLPGTNDNIDLIDHLLKDIGHHYEATDILESAGYTVEHAEDIETAPDDVVAWSRQTGAFPLAACDTYPSYQWWDGGNWRRAWPDDDLRTDVVVETEYEDLDTYDRNGNKSFRKQWEHGRLHKVLTIDGEPVDGEYLLVISSDWQGSRDIARLVDADEREELIK